MKNNRGTATREIKSRINIIEVVKRYVELRRVGNRWVAPCPFHQETKPSFSVNEEEGFFYCFGCNAAGDVFDFYSRINGLEFKETLEHLAAEAGVSLHGSHRPDPKAAEERNFRKTALKMYALASSHFQRNLQGKDGEACRNYLKNRRLSREIISDFELGWSLRQWQGLADTLQRSGFSLQQGIDAGLLAAGDRGGAYDRFRGRLVFPIKNLSGQIIAFGGRIIDDEDAAKYINSVDSILYKKSDNLYGLFQARRGISAAKSVVLTEGYMDVLTLHQFGYTNSCGVLGTALTKEQVRRLSGFCSDLELIFDGDGPGRKAALRACEMILAKGLRCRVVMLPEKKDIDDLLHNDGPEAFETLRRFAPDGLDFCIRMLTDSYAPKDALDWVHAFIQAVEHPEFLSRFISRLAQGLDLDEREIRRSVAGKLPGRPEAVSGTKNFPSESARHARQIHGVKKDALDREIMKFVVRYPHQTPSLNEAGASLVFTQDWARSFWDKVASCAPDYNSDAIVSLLDAGEKEFWGQYRIMQAPPSEKEQEELADVCELINRICLDKQGNACMQALRQGSGDNDHDLELLKALNETLVRQRTPGSTDE